MTNSLSVTDREQRLAAAKKMLRAHRAKQAQQQPQPPSQSESQSQSPAQMLSQPGSTPAPVPVTVSASAAGSARHARGHSRTSSISLSQRNSAVLVPPLSPVTASRPASTLESHRRTHSRTHSRSYSRSDSRTIFTKAAPNPRRSRIEARHSKRLSTKEEEASRTVARRPRPPSVRLSRTIPASAASLFGPSAPVPSPVSSTAPAPQSREKASSASAKRNSRHLRHASVSTKRDSMEIMTASGSASNFYSPADRRRSNRLSGTASASMLFGQQGSTLSQAWAWTADEEPENADESRLTALEKLEGKVRTSSDTSPRPSENEPRPSSSPFPFALEENASRNSVSLPPFEALHGQDSMDTAASHDLLRENEVSTQQDEFPIGVRDFSSPASDTSSDTELADLTMITTPPEGEGAEGLSTLLEEEEEEDNSFAPCESKEVIEHQRALRRKSLAPAPLKLQSRPLSMRYQGSLLRNGGGMPTSASLPDLAGSTKTTPLPLPLEHKEEQEEEAATPRPKRLSLLDDPPPGLKELKLSNSSPTASNSPVSGTIELPATHSASSTAARRRSSIMYKTDNGTIVPSRRSSMARRNSGSLSAVLLDELRGKAAQDAQALEQARQQLAVARLELAETRGQLDQAWSEVHEQEERFKGVERDLLTRIEALTRAQGEAIDAVAVAERKAAQLSEQLEIAEAERDTYKDDVDGWRERCAELEKRADSEKARAAAESQARQVVVGKTERLIAQLVALDRTVPEEDQLTQADTMFDAGIKTHERRISPVSASPTAPSPEATVKLLSNMRQQIFNLARTLEHEREERQAVDAQLAETRTELERTRAPVPDEVDETMDSFGSGEGAFALEGLGAPEIMVTATRGGSRNRHVFAYDSSNDSYSPPSTVATSARDGSVSILSDRRSSEDMFKTGSFPEPVLDDEDDLGLGNSHHTHASLAISRSSRRNTLHTLPEADEEVTPPTPVMDSQTFDSPSDPEAHAATDADFDPEASAAEPVEMVADPEAEEGWEDESHLLPRELFGRATTPELASTGRESSQGMEDETPTPGDEAVFDLGDGFDGWEDEPSSSEAKEFDRDWSFSTASSKAQRKVDRQRALVAQAHGGKVPSNFTPGPKVEAHDFFGIDTDLGLPPLTSSLPSLDLPPVPLSGLPVKHVRRASKMTRHDFEASKAVARRSLLGMTGSALYGMTGYFLSRPTSMVGAVAGVAAQAAHSCVPSTPTTTLPKHMAHESAAQSFSSAYSNTLHDGSANPNLQTLIQQQKGNPTLQAPPLLPSQRAANVLAPAPTPTPKLPRRLVPRTGYTSLVPAPRDTLDFVPATDGTDAWPVFNI